MDKLKLFPILMAEPIQEYNKTKSNLYIFNSSSNRGYMLDGFAANLCHRFDGTKSLESIILEFEREMGLKTNFYKEEIDSLLQDLQVNSLIEFLNFPKLSKEN
ncbi:MAG: hypothetical protein ACXVCE_03680 [Bacteriovorax sp.]